MAKSSFQPSIKRHSSREQAESLTAVAYSRAIPTRRELQKHLQTSEKYQQIVVGNNLAVFDKDFCGAKEASNFTEEIDELMDKGQILKNDNTTYVSHFCWNDKDIVVKRYNHKGFIHSLRHTIKRSRAYRGWLLSHRLRMLSISTPKVLAYIEQRRGIIVLQSYFVTEYAEGKSLYYFLRDDNIAEQKRSRVVEQIAELFAKLGKYRVTHGDLKHSNILITDNGPTIIDLDAMRVHRWPVLYKGRRAKDITRFLTKVDVSPELRRYCRRAILEKISSSTKSIGDFDKIRRDNYTLYINNSFRNDHFEQALLAGEKEMQKHYQLTPVRSSRFCRVYKFNVSFNGVEREIYFKEYLWRSVWDFIKHLFRAGRARRAFEASGMLADNGFDVPTIIAMGELKSSFSLKRNFLATLEVENAKEIHQFIPDSLKNLSREQLRNKRELIRAFGQTIGRMHAKGIFHGDLRLGNVLAKKQDDKWRFFFLDNERTKKFRRLPSRLRLKNLVQANMHRTAGLTDSDRIRFLKEYRLENKISKKQAMILIKRILKKTSQRLNKKRMSE